MAQVRACLQPSEGPACAAANYGEVRGSSPSWRDNFCDNGRAHVTGPTAEFGSTGFARWEQAPAVKESSYRRTLKQLPEPVRPERPEGKRTVPEPHGSLPAHPRGTRPPPDDVRLKPAATAPEPPLPRLGRPDGITGLRESDKETQFDVSLGRKIRVGQDTYRGTGRAGDKSLVYGASARVEDDPTFYKTMKDTPTFSRFVNSLPPKPSVSPHQRREDGLRRQAEQERRREAALVSTLNIEGVADDI
ncbi:hypothetical protein GPECTOR_2g1569 [Gonium pectorale]|uniref:Uncharacterized protein n=1 Tax=Gonium pectorale TaxID=33097 RepID=A0A150H1J1_GONPE|nr:hypothetical protein GPECTOR_2g1569 [Gonium pectorale]|eukprot:KXZ56017.1 hypothetical protein GPECTOR_2g1569 [Gonium pectorale]